VTVYVNGPVIGEQSYINNLARQISDTVQSNSINFNIGH